MVTLRNVLEDWHCFEESLNRVGKKTTDYPQELETINNICNTFAVKSGFTDISDALREISLDKKLDPELEDMHCKLLRSFIEIGRQSL